LQKLHNNKIPRKKTRKFQNGKKPRKFYCCWFSNASCSVIY